MFSWTSWTSIIFEGLLANYFFFTFVFILNSCQRLHETFQRNIFKIRGLKKNKIKNCTFLEIFSEKIIDGL